jgi:hypothetical protein
MKREMTRANYLKLASALAFSRPTTPGLLGEVVQWRRDVLALADVLQFDNPRFNRHRFLTACGFDMSETPANPDRVVGTQYALGSE